MQSPIREPPAWQFPGPSSRYRVQSVAKQKNLFTVVPSEATDKLGASENPLAPETFTSPEVYTILPRSSAVPTSMDRKQPCTPVESPTLAAIQPRDSPFSDYFTDESRTPASQNNVYRQAPEAQDVLVRLNNLGAQILQQRPSKYAFNAIANSLDQLERFVGVHMYRDLEPSHEMADSGFVDNQTCTSENSEIFTYDLIKTLDDLPTSSPHTNFSPISSISSISDYTHSIDRHHILSRTQSILERVSKTNKDLRQRFEEMRDLNDRHSIEVEQSEKEVCQLRLENESLKSDLRFDHSELLFLKLQLKALEVQLNEFHVDESATPDLHNKKILLDETLDEWKMDWDDIDARFKARREKHNVEPRSSKKMVKVRDDGRPATDQGDWKLDLCKERRGRVQSITLRRLHNDEHNAAFSSPTNDGTLEVDAIQRQTTQESASFGGLFHGGAPESEESHTSIENLSLSTISTVFDRQPPPGSRNHNDAGEEHVNTDVLDQHSDDCNCDELYESHKTPWQQLKENLIELAGMSDR